MTAPRKKNSSSSPKVSEPAGNGAQAENGNGLPATSGKFEKIHADPIDAKPSAEVLDVVSPVDDIEWQRQFFSDRRLEGARIPRRFWKKNLGNFIARDKKRRELVRDAKRFVQSFSFDDEYPRGLLLRGEVGCGKSHLAIAILREIIDKGYTGLFYNSPALLQEIRDTFDAQNPRTESALIDELLETDLLIFDDLGAEKSSEWTLDRFYLIINKRYESCKPIIVTTNLDKYQLKERLGDRILSRLVEMCEFMGDFPPEDYRRRKLKHDLI